MDTSNCTTTGSDTFSTGRMNWLYFSNTFTKSRCSASEQPPSEREQKAVCVATVWFYMVKRVRVAAAGTDAGVLGAADAAKVHTLINYRGSSIWVSLVLIW